MEYSEDFNDDTVYSPEILWGNKQMEQSRNNMIDEIIMEEADDMRMFINEC